MKTTISLLAFAALALSAIPLTAHAVTDSELANAKSSKADAQVKINDLKSKLNQYISDEADINAKRQVIEQTAQSLDSQITSLTKTIKARETVLKSQARSIQTSNQTSYLSAILDAKSLTNAVQRVVAVNTITQANANVIKEQTAAKQDLENKSKAMQKNYGDYLKLSQDLNAKEKTVAIQQAELDKATAQYELTITTGEAERQAAQAKLTTAENALEQATAADNQLQQQQTQNQINQKATQTAAQNQTSAVTKNEPTVSQSTGSGTVFDYADQFMRSGSTYNGYAGGGCTDYVWQYFAARGVIIPNVMPGNGKDWAYQMPRAPKLVPGVIASFAGGAHSSSPYYGHVAVVEEVYGDGSFKVSEGGGPVWGGTRIIPNQAGVTFVLP